MLSSRVASQISTYQGDRCAHIVRSGARYGERLSAVCGAIGLEVIEQKLTNELLSENAGT
jgi:hypothetical protein